MDLAGIRIGDGSEWDQEWIQVGSGAGNGFGRDRDWGWIRVGSGMGSGMDPTRPEVRAGTLRNVPSARGILIPSFSRSQFGSRGRGDGGRSDRDRDPQHRDRPRNSAHPGGIRVGNEPTDSRREFRESPPNPGILLRSRSEIRPEIPAVDPEKGIPDAAAPALEKKFRSLGNSGMAEWEFRSLPTLSIPGFRESFAAPDPSRRGSAGNSRRKFPRETGKIPTFPGSVFPLFSHASNGKIPWNSSWALQSSGNSGMGGNSWNVQGRELDLMILVDPAWDIP